MIGDILQPTHLLFVLVIALLVLGPKRLPEVGRALGRGLRDFRNALSTDDLRDQMISTTTTEGGSTPTQAPGEATETQVQAGSQSRPGPAPAENPTVPSATDTGATAPTPPREPAATASAPDRTQ